MPEETICLTDKEYDQVKEYAELKGITLEEATEQLLKDSFISTFGGRARATRQKSNIITIKRFKSL